MPAQRLVFEDAIKCLDWLKKFGPAHNILGPVEGQGITTLGFGAILVTKHVHVLYKISLQPRATT